MENCEVQSFYFLIRQILFSDEQSSKVKGQRSKVNHGTDSRTSDNLRSDLVHVLSQLFPSETDRLSQDHARVRVPSLKVGPGLDRRQPPHALRSRPGLGVGQVRT